VKQVELSASYSPYEGMNEDAQREADEELAESHSGDLALSVRALSVSFPESPFSLSRRALFLCPGEHFFFVPESTFSLSRRALFLCLGEHFLSI